MSHVVIKVENLSKRYTIRHQNGRGDGLRHAIHDAATAPLRWLRQHGAWSMGHGVRSMEHGAASNGRPPSDSGLQAPGSQLSAPGSLLPAPCSEEFWALKGVSFEVKQGEVLGIIGRNGAGKTTLLKILSRITEPTEGRVRIRGRVASLLEVGTGFHPELTGRENIFVNGAILGMTRAEVQKKFDEIVDFSGVEKFIDTPVKRYSSGMYVRLAFAVAAHLDPEILIIDEVLAVGDAEFQKKCLGKMHDVVAGQGRTILFVSHNMQAVKILCQRVLVLSDGSKSFYGDVSQGITQYLSDIDRRKRAESDMDRRPGSGELRVISARPAKEAFECSEEKAIHFCIKRVRFFQGRFYVSCHIVDQTGAVILQCDSRLVGLWMQASNTHSVDFIIRTPWLKPGSYRVDIILRAGDFIDYFEGACVLNVAPLLPYTAPASLDATGNGTVFADFSFSHIVGSGYRH